MNPSLQERWTTLFARLGVAEDVTPAFERLCAAYAEEHRAYHNLEHIAECLAELDSTPAAAGGDLDAIELAIWYHDAVYDTHASDNEAMSAEWADRDLDRFGIPDSTRVDVTRLILATQHSAAPVQEDEALLVSIDLSTLGKSPEHYAAYAEAIRREYAWVPDSQFADGRAKVLRGFLDRAQIYPDLAFRVRYEAQARRNLAWELEMIPSLDSVSPLEPRTSPTKN